MLINWNTDGQTQREDVWENSFDSKQCVQRSLFAIHQLGQIRLILPLRSLNHINTRCGSASYELKWLVENVLFWTACRDLPERRRQIQERLRCIRLLCDPLFPWPPLFPRCECEARSGLISRWNPFPSIAPFNRRLSAILREWEGPAYFLCVCVCVCAGDGGRFPFPPQGYIITWIIRPGQPEKEESKKAIQKDLTSDSYSFNVHCGARAHTHTHTHNKQKRWVSFFSAQCQRLSLYIGLKKRPKQTINVLSIHSVHTVLFV